jgi:hypothetical protein
MREKRKGLVLLFGLAVLFCACGSVQAETTCDTDPAAVFYEPTVDPATLNSLLGLIGNVPIDVSEPVEFDGLFNTHSLIVDVSTSLDLSGVTFLVTPDVGSLTVSLHLPGIQDAGLILNIEHDVCWGEPYTSCQDEYNGCNTQCGVVQNACLAACGINFTCIAGCYASGVACSGQCLVDNGNCGLCGTENGILDSVINGTPATLSFTDATVTQTADVCVSGTCAAIHPLEGTEAVVNGLHLQLFDTSDPTWGSLFQTLNDLINSLFQNSTDIGDAITGAFEDDDGGLLIEVFSQEIGSDGCTPVKEVTDCLAGGCSTLHPEGAAKNRSPGVLLYGLPVALLFALILRRRKR